MIILLAAAVLPAAYLLSRVYRMDTIEKEPWSLLRKLLLGAAVGGLCYALFPLFPALSSVFAARDQVLSRTLSLGALALSSALSAEFLFLLSLMAGGKRAKN